jgi:translation initiation factor IF-1
MFYHAAFFVECENKVVNVGAIVTRMTLNLF